MKGTLFVIILISLLIGGIIAMKNMQAHQDSEEPGKVEAVQRARDVSAIAEQKLNQTQKKYEDVE